ncbi:DUF6477 family protein [Rhodobacteraceae bacterium D3-12]|nr:DUF6477 family protein [Rhodobacteraceae bacterium D3-12]
MTDIFSMLNALRRPRLLIQAARAGSEDYRRDPHLYRLLGHRILPKSGEALLLLMEFEAEQNQLRLDKSSAYSLISHVDLLIAMMGEAQLVRAFQSAPTLVEA